MSTRRCCSGRWALPEPPRRLGRVVRIDSSEQLTEDRRMLDLQSHFGGVRGMATSGLWSSRRRALPRRGQTGFTLIELLIVVAIIGLIAAIAIPNLRNAMNKAKQSKTLADIK